MIKTPFFALVGLLIFLVSCSSPAPEEAVAIDINDVFEEFMDCQNTSTEPFPCKEYTAKAINGYFVISDFADPDNPGNYLPIEKIMAMVDQHSSWEKLGPADDQEVLDRAQELANNGKAVIAVSDQKGIGNVAIIMKGEQEKSGSWGGLNCPHSASFFMKNHKNSYVGKKLSYAWGKPDGIWVYARS